MFDSVERIANVSVRLPETCQPRPRHIAIKFDPYGHLFPGSEHEARGLLDAYMARADH